MRNIYSVFPVICILLTSLQAQPRAEIARFLEAYAQHGRLSGAVWVQQGTDTLLARGFGLADDSSPRPNDIHTVFNIGSLSKQFTAAGILTLVEQGQIDPAAPINTYLGPYASPQWEKVSVHHLLSHRSGIPSLLQGGQGLDDVMPDTQPVSLQELIGHFSALKLRSKPGKKYRYNNSGYVLLAAIIEQVSGQAYGEFMEEAVWQPAGLMETCHGVSDSSRLALPYFHYGPAHHAAVPAYHHSWLIGAGSVYSTAADLAQWMQHIHSDAFLNADLRALYTRRHSESGGDTYYGYGWQILNAEGPALLHHDGTFFGYTCDLLYDPGQDITALILTHQTHAALEQIGASEAFVRETNQTLIDLVKGGTVDPLPALTQASAAAFAGRYRHPDGTAFRVQSKAGTWHLIPDSLSLFSLRYRVPLDPETEEGQRAERAVAALATKKMRQFGRECDGTMRALTWTGLIRLGFNSIMQPFGKIERGVLFAHAPGQAAFRLFAEKGMVDFALFFDETHRIQGLFDTRQIYYDKTEAPASLEAKSIHNGLFVSGFEQGEPDIVLRLEEQQLKVEQGKRTFAGWERIGD